ncbi:hypothetical protein CFRS1_v004019 [Colletotrichum fructicola]|nr:hypothetical protein CFRS1_v004019 [Colletotrichum fructicola]
MHSATFGKGKRYGILGYLPEQGSKEAELYALNASTSPLLLLPPEIRNKIYALLLAHRRIHVLHAPRAHPPKFHCLTLRASANPWTHKRRHVLSRGMTLLAGVCRQLYRETDLIPYRECVWSWGSVAVMERFLVAERRLGIQDVYEEVERYDEKDS